MLEFLVRCVPEHVRDVVEQTVGQHQNSVGSNYAAPLSVASAKPLPWQQQQQLSNQPAYYYPNKNHRQTFINGYESRFTGHQAFLVRSIFFYFTIDTGLINGSLIPCVWLRLSLGCALYRM